VHLHRIANGSEELAKDERYGSWARVDHIVAGEGCRLPQSRVLDLVAEVQDTPSMAASFRAMGGIEEAWSQQATGLPSADGLNPGHRVWQRLHLSR